MKNFSKLILILFLFIVLPGHALAISDPTNAINNKYGIHINDENDLQDASQLVNSRGGDWGYVTFVIREDEMDVVRWSRAFEKMRELHLIPIVRIATSQSDMGWIQASVSGTSVWADFLDALPWVTQNRYVIIGNEPNHATEWGGEVNPEEYADFLVEQSRALKLKSSDFYILPAGLDASAPNDLTHMDEEKFLERMLIHQTDLFDYIDGWTSHSYPNPGFSGSVDKTGRGSIKTYAWEIDVLKKLGLQKKLPIFITETGWAHNSESGIGLDEKIVSENLIKAYRDIWIDDNIVAITPFILNYPGKPFTQFSWKDTSGKYHQFYFDIKNLNKVQGQPILVDKEITKPHATLETVVRSVYNLWHSFWTA
ncbi:hypothetical protein IPM62_03220 [Candidatus Woesebacteria bacterium]|nr:MAG: hypothetical protein IPM62_03220 [Candidatus Woesebacteria bacterium]